MPRVRLRERGEGSAASLAQQPRDAFDLVQVLQQQRTVARVLVVCTIPKADTEAQRLTLAPSLASSTRDRKSIGRVRGGSPGRTLCDVGEHPSVLRHLQATIQHEAFVLDEVCQPVVQHAACVVVAAPLEARHHRRREDLLEAVGADPRLLV